MTRKATSSFVRTFAGIRATARTNGLSARLSSRPRPPAEAVAEAVPCACVRDLRLQRHSRRRQVRDQPLPVDLLHLLVRTHGSRNLARVDVDVVAFEVQRPFGAV